MVVLSKPIVPRSPRGVFICSSRKAAASTSLSPSSRLRTAVSKLKPQVVIKVVQHSVVRFALAAIVSLAVCGSTYQSVAESYSYLKADSGMSYEEMARKRTLYSSNIPSSEETAAIMQLYDRDLFTEESWQGMMKLQEYGRYVEKLCNDGVESAQGCEQCTDNRLILERAWQMVNNEYYDPHGHFSEPRWAEKLIEALQSAGGAIETKSELYTVAAKMLATLGDPYSEYLPPSQFRRALRRPLPAERNYLEAQFVGAGIQFGGLSPLGGRVVDAPLAGSPAEAAGITHGDRILAIDGTPAEQFRSADEMARALRGPAGSLVEVQLARGSGWGAVDKTLVLERRALPQPAVKTARLQLADGRSVSYLRLHYFASETTRGVRSAVRLGEEQDVAGYILDLRNNPGGVFEEAVAMAALFLEPGQAITETVHSQEVVDTVWSAGALSPEIFPPSIYGADKAALTRRPVVLLMNGSSASASEVLAGALQGQNRAVVVGERSYGKGVVQYYFPMEDGSGLKLTVAKYLTPTKYDISRRGGLRPDIACSDYPHGVLSRGTADHCVLKALDIIWDQGLTGGNTLTTRA